MSSLYQTSCMQKHTKLISWRPRTKVAKHVRFNDCALKFRQKISRSDISMQRTDLHSASTSVAILSAISMGSAAWQQKGQKRNGRNLAPPGSTVTRRHRILWSVLDNPMKAASHRNCMKLLQVQTSIINLLISTKSEHCKNTFCTILWLLRRIIRPYMLNHEE